MTNAVLRAFTDHPASVGESYFEHLRFAMGFSGMLFLASLAALIHSILPFCCKSTAGNLIKKMHARISHRS